MLAISLALHLVFFFLASHLALFQNDLPLQEAIYVDVLNMPVESPQTGSPSGTAKTATDAGRPPAPAPLPAPAPRAMKLPSAKPATVPRKGEKAETSQEYEARLAALEAATESRHQEAALADIRNRIAARTRGNAPAGMPGGVGSQAGSDYAAYLQSRLRDSFELTIAWQSKSPLMVVRLFIDQKGALKSYKIEKSTGDVVFEDAVDRAINLAKKNFTPPPNGKEFSQGFVFKPQGVEKK